MDWNWFFSSVAQSGAAIVGIFGAFIITKIINNQQEYKRKNQVLADLLATSQRMQGAVATGPISWYTRNSLKDAIAEVKKKLEDELKPRAADEYYDEIDFPPFVNREER